MVRTLEDTEDEDFLGEFDDDISPDKFVYRENFNYKDVNIYLSDRRRNLLPAMPF